mgnify:CR=1 FL=1
MFSSIPKNVLIAGASGGIGAALVEHFLSSANPPALTTISRAAISKRNQEHRHLQCDLSKPSAIKTAEEFLADESIKPDWVIHCSGMLTLPPQVPEKSLGMLNQQWLLRSMQVNVLSHVHLAQALEQQFSVTRELLWASLSAKVGSIGDNRLGGWYSYRMSKAALNMFVRTLAVEWRRKLRSACVVAVHPGTTDTPLTQPYQKNIPASRLYTVDQTAQRICNVLTGLGEQDNGSFLNWDGSQLDW